MRRYSQAVIDEAVEALLCCADTRLNVPDDLAEGRATIYTWDLLGCDLAWPRRRSQVADSILARARRVLELTAAKAGPFSTVDAAATAEILSNSAAIDAAPELARKLLEVDEVLRLAAHHTCSGGTAWGLGYTNALDDLRRRIGLGGG